MKYRIPDENTPGWLRRETLRQRFMDAEGAAKVDAMVAWLSEYIEDKSPSDVLLNASEKEINELIASITGTELPDPKASESTGNG